MSDKYCIIRNRFMGSSSVVAIGLTLEEAQAHCRRDDTRGEGWFDGYTLEENRASDVAFFRAYNGIEA